MTTALTGIFFNSSLRPNYCRIAEKIRGRPISIGAMYRFSSVGIVLLIFLVINGLGNDISRLTR